MARKQIQEPEAPDQPWLLTFSDCMTLLLCFFVLLLTFSSFDEIKFEQLAGAFRTMSHVWIDENSESLKPSLVDRPTDDPDAVQDGALFKTKNERSLDRPKDPIELLDMDIYKDRTVFFLPSDQMFYGHTGYLSDPGKEYLASMAKFLRIHHCRVVIGETTGQDRNWLGARRAWSTMRFFTWTLKLGEDRFSLDGECRDAKDRFPGQHVLSITLMNVKLDEDR